MTHDKEELEQVQNEHEHLRTTWIRFMDEILNGVSYERHAPPALMSACLKIVESQSGIEVPSDANPMLAVPFHTMADYGATMFIFGQFCMKDGFLAGNMVQCGCDQIDDQDLKDFISKS